MFTTSQKAYSRRFISTPKVAFHVYAQPEGPREIVISEIVDSSFISTSLEEVLRVHGIRRLYVIGLTTDRCVSTIVRMAGNLMVTDMSN